MSCHSCTAPSHGPPASSTTATSTTTNTTTVTVRCLRPQSRISPVLVYGQRTIVRAVLCCLKNNSKSIARVGLIRRALVRDDQELRRRQQNDVGRMRPKQRRVELSNRRTISRECPVSKVLRLLVITRVHSVTHTMSPTKGRGTLVCMP